MCLVVYIASSSSLPLIAWNSTAPSFHVTEVRESDKPVVSRFSVSHVKYAGSHTGCGCGFNEGRQYPGFQDNPQDKADALKTSAQFEKYIRENDVVEIYSCWSGDEPEQTEHSREISAREISTEEFYFRERELLRIRKEA